MPKQFLLLFVSLLLINAAGQTLTTDWQKLLERRLGEFESCGDKMDDTSPCNRFVGAAFEEVYGIKDFVDPIHKGQFLSANLIDTYVIVSKQWISLGPADNQQALNEAAAAANDKRAVIAVAPGELHGHVAIVLPGPLTDSSTWKLKVPNSACFFLGKPKQSFVSDKLSKAFTTPAGVKLFARVY